MPDIAKPWQDCPPSALRAVCGVLTDIDDTLTTDGAIPPGTLRALAALHDAGLPVIAITGRPKGWSVPVARDTALSAVVAENGAVALWHDEDQALVVEYAQDAATRERNDVRLQEVAQRILAEVPGAALARDSAGRVTDIAIDHSEFAHLDAGRIAQVVALMRDEGMNATVSSIHIHGWYGEPDKLSGARWIVQRLLHRDLDAEHDGWVYVGDSTNDQLLFAHFPLSVGVANLRRFADQLQVWPAWITDGERGAGFEEVARALLAVQSQG